MEKLKIDQRIFLSPSKRKLEINLVQSNFHLEITPRCVEQLALYVISLEYLLVRLEITIALSFKKF